MKTRLLCLLAASVLAAPLGAAHAQDKITLKLAHSLPGTHYMWEQSMKPFTEEVVAATGGKVQFEIYPANQLGKDYYTLLKSGLADVAMIIPYYAGDKFPATSVTELPDMAASSCEATSKYWALAAPGGALDKLEYAPAGLHVLFVNTSPPYYLMTTTKKVETLDDAAGLKIWANGSALGKSVRALGGVPVSIPAPELYDSVLRGTVDGAAFLYPSVPQYKLEDKIRYVAEGASLGGGSWFLAMTDKAWEALPEDVRNAMHEAGPKAQAGLCAWLDEEAQKRRDQMAKENGLTITALPDEQVKTWKAKLGEVATQWAAEMDAAGRSGSELLDAMLKAGQ